MAKLALYLSFLERIFFLLRGCGAACSSLPSIDIVFLTFIGRSRPLEDVCKETPASQDPKSKG